MRLSHSRSRVWLGVATLVSVAVAPWTLAAQTAAISPAELVRRVVENEIKPDSSTARSEFLDLKKTAHGSQTRRVIETRQGNAGMLVAIDDRPLGPDQHQAEIARLDHLASDPKELEKKQKADREDTDRTTRMLRAFPNAFRFTYAESGDPNGEQVRLNFSPNPNYDPPSHLEQVLTAMQGYIVLDSVKNRIVQVDGTLMKEVGFGWGILGHLDKGGHFLVTQAEVVPGDWEVTRLILEFKGKALFFKNISIKSDETLSDFRPAPENLSFAQAVELLKKEQGSLAENHSNDDNRGGR